MKKLISSYLLGYLILISIAFSLSRCTNANSKENLVVDQITSLLDRSEKIRVAKEWEHTQNLYVNLRDQILKNNDSEAKLKLAQLFVIEARITGEHGHYYPGALKSLDDLLDDPNIEADLKFRGLMTKAGVQLSLHEFATALKTGQEAQKLNDKNAQVYGVLVDANVELGTYKQAVVYADQMISIKPDLRSYSRIAYLREIHGDVEGAFEAMKLAVDAGYPGTEETAWAAQTLGEMYLQIENTEAAKNIFESVLKVRENYPFAVGGIADALVQEKKYQEAELKYKEGMDIIPEVGFYINLAKLYKMQGRDNEAKQLQPEIMEMLKDDVDHGHNMNMEYADIYIDPFDDLPKALEYAQLEYEKRPDNIDVNRLLAKIYLKQERFDKAKIHFNKASTTGSKHPELAEMSELLNK